MFKLKEFLFGLGLIEINMSHIKILTQQKQRCIYHVIEDISLMDMNGDESLKLCPLHFGEISGCLVDEGVEELKEG